MLGEKQLLEQRLQETAGELVEAERALSSRTVLSQVCVCPNPDLQSFTLPEPALRLPLLPRFFSAFIYLVLKYWSTCLSHQSGGAGRCTVRSTSGGQC